MFFSNNTKENKAEDQKSRLWKLSDLVKLVHGRLHRDGKKVDQKLITIVLQNMIDEIKESYVNDKFDRITLQGLCTINSVWSKERLNSNPFTGKLRNLPATRRLKWRTSVILTKDAN